MVFLQAFLFKSIKVVCLVLYASELELLFQIQKIKHLSPRSAFLYLLYRLLQAPFMQQLDLYHLRRQSEHRPKDDKFRIIGPSDPRTIAMARICGELFICFIVVGLRSISTAASDIFSLTHTQFSSIQIASGSFLTIGYFPHYRLIFQRERGTLQII